MSLTVLYNLIVCRYFVIFHKRSLVITEYISSIRIFYYCFHDFLEFSSPIIFLSLSFIFVMITSLIPLKIIVLPVIRISNTSHCIIYNSEKAENNNSPQFVLTNRVVTQKTSETASDSIYTTQPHYRDHQIRHKFENSTTLPL